VIDIHTHLLPAIDDGPATERESIAMARVAWQAGTREIVCTPHLSERCTASPQDVHDAVDRMRAALLRAKVPIQLHPGREVNVGWLPNLSDEELRASTLGATGRWLLLELPYRGWPIDLPAVLEDLSIRGFSIVLAHVERIQAVQRQPDRLREAVGLGTLLQVNAPSFVGDHGPDAKRAAEALARLGWVHLLASDAHSADRRPPDMREGLAAAASAAGIEPDELRWMVDDAPRAILAGARFTPPRPPSRPESPEPAGWDRPSRGARSRA
jgi:protein-tyrosine phosphatase